MSLHILKPGLLDMIQDGGRFGQAHLGINPSGVMDRVAMVVANTLVGNSPNSAVLEMHFPAAEIQLEQDILLALAGADFTAQADGITVPMHTPVFIQAGTTLKFQRLVTGARCYLAVQGSFDLPPWHNSWSTNQVAGIGGFQGRALQAGDRLPLSEQLAYTGIFTTEKMKHPPWQANVSGWYSPSSTIRFCLGPEYDWLSKSSQNLFIQSDWQIGMQSDRMGYRLNGPELRQQKLQELVSSAVAPGTIQLLPNGQLIVLMADSQTTGGYPRIGHIIQADLSRLAQLQAGQQFNLQKVSLDSAFAALQAQELALRRLRIGCTFRLADFFGQTGLTRFFWIDRF